MLIHCTFHQSTGQAALQLHFGQRYQRDFPRRPFPSNPCPSSGTSLGACIANRHMRLIAFMQMYMHAIMIAQLQI